MFQEFFTRKFLDDFGTTTSCIMNCYKIYIYWDNIRRYHRIVWKKIICIICIYQPETDTFIGIRISHCSPQGIPLCTGKYPHYYSGIFYKFHTHTHANITEGSIFISELLSLKLEAWIYQ